MRWVALITLVVLLVVFFSPLLLSWGSTLKARVKQTWDERNSSAPRKRR